MTFPQTTPKHLVFCVFLCFLLISSAAMGTQQPGQFDTKKASGIVANPSSIDFGSVQVGQSKTVTETLTNTAQISLVVYSNSISGTGFTSSGLTLPLTLAPGQSYTFSVSFAPQASGAVSGTLTLSSRNGHSKLIIALTGTATAAGTLTVSPTSLNFGNVTVGTSKSLSGSLAASGADVTVSSGSVNTSEFTISGITFPVTVASGRTVAFTATFSPQSSGSASATASFVSNASNSPGLQSLSGMGTAPLQHNVSLVWDPSGSPDVVGYNVYRASQSGGPYGKINPALDSTTAYDDTSVTSGHTYYYVTTAVDGTGLESTYSNQVKAAIPTP